jgi:hypothetical protein
VIKKRGVLLFSHTAKGFTIIYTLAKPPKNSHLTPQLSEDLESKASQLKNQVTDMSDSMLKMVEFPCSQEILKTKKEDRMENLMDQIWNDCKIPWKPCSYKGGSLKEIL